MFLAFTSYDAARSGAEAEALTVAQQVETAQFFPPAVADELTGELVCYARSVAGIQWARMQSGTLGEQVNPWAVELYKTLRTDHAGHAGGAVGLRHVARPDERIGRRRATTASTVPSGSSRSRCGWCCSSARR